MRKPLGPTSHDVVDEIRRLFGQRKVGHAGTLDPMAEGVLVVCLGKATRIVQYLMGAPKQYRATIILGRTTDTQDATGAIIKERDASSVTREQFVQVSESFIGEIEQIPPMVSAIKRQGKPLYKLARRGEHVERKPRLVTVYSLDVIEFQPGSTAEAEIVVECSSGTYIRTLCADIGEKLGCGGHMTSLIRTGVGRFTLGDSVSLDFLADACSRGALAEHVIGINEALTDMVGVTLDETHARLAAHGVEVAVQTPASSGGTVRVLSPEGELIALGTVVGECGEKTIRPKVVLIGPET